MSLRRLGQSQARGSPLTKLSASSIARPSFSDFVRLSQGRSFVAATALPPSASLAPQPPVPFGFWGPSIAAASPAHDGRPETARSAPPPSPRSSARPNDALPAARHGCSGAQTRPSDDPRRHRADDTGRCPAQPACGSGRLNGCRRYRYGPNVILPMRFAKPYEIPPRNLPGQNAKTSAALRNPCDTSEDVAPKCRAIHGVCMKVRKVRNPFLGQTFVRGKILPNENFRFSCVDTEGGVSRVALQRLAEFAGFPRRSEVFAISEVSQGYFRNRCVDLKLFGLR